jgi:hypothetical protein
MIDFPNIDPDAATFALKSNSTAFASELNATVQHAVMPGDKWTFTLTFTNRGQDQARLLKAFITSLQGPAGRFTMSPPDLNNQGVGTTGQVNGAGQVGKTINTKGWPINTTGILKAGDYIQIGNELKMVTADTNSNASGNAVVTIAPPLRKSPPNNAAINAATPKGVFYLTDDNQASWRLSAPYIYAISFSGEEDIN